MLMKTFFVFIRISVRQLRKILIEKPKNKQMWYLLIGCLGHSNGTEPVITDDVGHASKWIRISIAYFL